MKVLHVYRTYFPDPEGGLQEAIRQICRAVEPHGIKSTVFCLSPQPEPALLCNDGIETWRSRSFAAPASCDLGGPNAWRLFSRLAKTHDVIHYHFPWPFADLLHLTVRPRARAVLTYHSDIVRQAGMAKLYSPFMWAMLQSMETIIATSPDYASTSLVLTDSRVRDRVRVIPLGKEDLPRPVGSHASDEPYFLFLGVLRYYKGLQTLIKAAKQVNGKIIIAGAGPEEATLQSLARLHGVKNVEFRGRVSEEEKQRLLAGCHGLVLPSHQRSEAFGMVLVEAAMFGKPMISCEIGTGTSFVNVAGETGIVVEPEDPAALAAAMNRLFEDETLAKQYGSAARKRYEKMFSLKALGGAYAALYRGGYSECHARGSQEIMELGSLEENT
jgi:glycosyltransferase involved in cell wall biosynthesis